MEERVWLILGSIVIWVLVALTVTAHIVGRINN